MGRGDGCGDMTPSIDRDIPSQGVKVSAVEASAAEELSKVERSVVRFNVAKNMFVKQKMEAEIQKWNILG